MPGHAIITGGSSGIGLAAAKQLCSRGVSVSLVARNRDKLAAAREMLLAAANGQVAVQTFSADVRDPDGLKQAIASAVDSLGPPGWGICSAGIVIPGTFVKQTLRDHEDQWRTNYLGSLQFAHFILPHLEKSSRPRLVLIASGAAFAGLYGYSSYGPAKFAVRGLAESLRVELKPRNVSVTIAFPGDTDTPQLRSELKLRPKVTSQLASGVGVMSPDAVAKGIIAAAERGDFQVTFGWQLRLLARTHSLIAPLLRSYQDRLVKRSGEDL
ncbi:MAG: SDR family oxidoreductase [Aestuariivirga sp.]|uniref:SDR family oxidoreductase n=1 Tax=Aestuariivirga sp. TaxID=2650926 RepID=UPI0025C11BE0|nr:SDR family oxidoreductase [Aestuariivirga sp.]MCA3561694.1 SDR family oxidoreductase [Aestuariivirga sp.]